MDKIDLLQIEPILGNIFKDTISQKLTFRVHRRLLNCFWKAVQQNLHRYSETMNGENSLTDSIQELLHDIEDILGFC